jgi:hypothetical protein
MSKWFLKRKGEWLSMLCAIFLCLFMLCNKITGRQDMQLTLVMIAFPCNNINWPHFILQCCYLWLFLASEACPVCTLILATKTVAVLLPSLPAIKTWYALRWTFLFIRKFASCSHISALLNCKFSWKSLVFAFTGFRSRVKSHVLLLRFLSNKQPCY